MKITDELKKIMNKYNWKSIKNIDWNYISYYEKLSEEFIEEYLNKLTLIYIAEKQNMSKDFVKKHKLDLLTINKEVDKKTF